MERALEIKPVKPKKSSEIIAQRLRLAIVSGDLSKGEDLPVERNLIETFGVSRTTMREALRILETEGLLQITRGAKGGAKIIGPTLALAAHAVGMVLQAQDTLLADVQIARQIIEPPAARMVAERQSPDAIEKLEGIIVAEEAAAGTTDSPFQAMKFHEALVQLSGNHTLSAFLMVLHEIHEGVAVALSQESRSAARSNRTIETHKALVELIKAGDGAGAEALWHDYWEWITPFTHPEAAVVNVLQKLETSE
ncbi:MAG: FadR family transcriptional regulator [Gammaproteobacteria bacterium]|jgi:DNA-binding FadR family transcriptional regulator|nr:FadR family transcriptional regulator [Gammaproteobacteria bacterium]MBT6584846.1 FadR family transcriptional regulator [Gammaproteobacteria bacterium]MBT7028070.1 FadR family transcriptional regulator [Verrucomicrobiota bacterium]MBT7880564.1 FadR family transcriptional regulator [Gammaproteobacteria bacterium]